MSEPASPPRRRGGRKARLAERPADTGVPTALAEERPGACAVAGPILDDRRDRTLVIACGALARELIDVVRLNGWTALDVACLPAKLHNRPEKIPHAMECKIRSARRRHGYGRILALYGDCGTGGELDRVLAAEGVERIEGAHCYAFYAGLDAFEALHEAEPGTFYLTDYLVRHFDGLVIRGLGLDRHPELLPAYFGNYRRLVHLAQIPDADLDLLAQAAAARLGLAHERRDTGLAGIADFLGRALPARERSGPSP